MARFEKEATLYGSTGVAQWTIKLVVETIDREKQTDFNCSVYLKSYYMSSGTGGVHYSFWAKGPTLQTDNFKRGDSSKFWRNDSRYDLLGSGSTWYTRDPTVNREVTIDANVWETNTGIPLYANGNTASITITVPKQAARNPSDLTLVSLDYSNGAATLRWQNNQSPVPYKNIVPTQTQIGSGEYAATLPAISGTATSYTFEQLTPNSLYWFSAYPMTADYLTPVLTKEKNWRAKVMAYVTPPPIPEFSECVLCKKDDGKYAICGEWTSDSKYISPAMEVEITDGGQSYKALISSKVFKIEDDNSSLQRILKKAYEEEGTLTLSFSIYQLQADSKVFYPYADYATPVSFTRSSLPYAKKTVMVKGKKASKIGTQLYIRNIRGGVTGLYVNNFAPIKDISFAGR